MVDFYWGRAGQIYDNAFRTEVNENTSGYQLQKIFYGGHNTPGTGDKKYSNEPKTPLVGQEKYTQVVDF